MYNLYIWKRPLHCYYAYMIKFYVIYIYVIFVEFCKILRTLYMRDCPVNDIFDILIWMCIFLCVFHGKQIEIAKVSVFIFSTILIVYKYLRPYVLICSFLTCLLCFWKNKISFRYSLYVCKYRYMIVWWYLHIEIYFCTFH